MDAIQTLLKAELKYQQQQLRLIPSENYVSPEIMKIVGSAFMNKYAEGQPGHRYYQGSRNVDQAEAICRSNALALFKLNPARWHVNVQAVTGSIANLAVYNAVLAPGDRVLSLALTHGGHLSHGWKLKSGESVSFSSRIYDVGYYGVDKVTGLIDYGDLEKIAAQFKPKLIISGGTAYPRQIDFARIAGIARACGALYLADVAHEAGLIAGNQYDSPFESADIVTMTTRKTLRGPIGALIFCRQNLARAIDRSVFPGLQGGPMMNSIAAIATALAQANTREFTKYAQQIILNTAALADELTRNGLHLITGGTDTHLVVVDIRNFQPDGHIAASILEAADIIVNKNTIPYDSLATAWRPSGIRLGTPAVTTRGMKKTDMREIADLITEALTTIKFEPRAKDEDIRAVLEQNPDLSKLKKQVHTFTSRFPVYKGLR